MKAIVTVAAIGLLSCAANAADRAGAQAAYGAAMEAEAQAAQQDNRWIPAEAALKAAKEALAAGKWDAAAEQSARARALAQRAVEQSHEQEAAWQDAVIR